MKSSWMKPSQYVGHTVGWLVGSVRYGSFGSLKKHNTRKKNQKINENIFFKLEFDVKLLSAA